MRRGATIIDDWIAEAEERGERRGELRGSINAARRVTRDTVELRFGELPPALAARIEAADADACMELLRRVLRAKSLEELESL